MLEGPLYRVLRDPGDGAEKTRLMAPPDWKKRHRSPVHRHYWERLE